jgi:hypothetical protein
MMAALVDEQTSQLQAVLEVLAQETSPPEVLVQETSPPEVLVQETSVTKVLAPTSQELPAPGTSRGSCTLEGPRSKCLPRILICTLPNTGP